MKVLIAVICGTFLWSIYPLIASFALESMTALSFVLAMQVTAAFVSTIAAIAILIRQKKVATYRTALREMDGGAWLNILVSGASSAFNHVLFVIAMGLAHQGGVALIYDSWPIMAAFMAPFLLQRQWEDLTFRDFFLGIMACIGLGFIVFSDDNINLRSFFGDHGASFDYMSLLGYVLAALGGYMVALNLLTKTAITLQFSALRNSTLEIMISEAWARSIGAVLLYLTIWGMGETLSFTPEGLKLAVFGAVGILIAGGGFQTYSMMKARNPNVSIFYYLVPVLAVVWLVVAGQTSVTALFFIGGALVLLSNVLLLWEGQKTRRAARIQEAMMRDLENRG